MIANDIAENFDPQHPEGKRERKASTIKLQDYEDRLAKLYDFFVPKERKRR